MSSRGSIFGLWKSETKKNKSNLFLGKIMNTIYLQNEN